MLTLLALLLGVGAVGDGRVASHGTPRPPRLLVGTPDGERLSAREEPAIIAGRGGNDIVTSVHEDSQLAGGDGFDILLARGGARRLSPGAGGGLVAVGGTSGSRVVLEGGVNFVFGSEGHEHVHVAGGLNFLFLGGGDDSIEIANSSINVVWGGVGRDSLCHAGEGGLVLGQLFLEETHSCQASRAVGEVVETEVVGILTNRRSVIIRRGKFNMHDPQHRGSPEQEFTLELLGIVEGPEPLARRVYRPGGSATFSDGRRVSESAAGSSEWPREGVPLRLFLTANTFFLKPDNQWFLGAKPGSGPLIGHVISPVPGDTQALPGQSAAEGRAVWRLP